jgi:sulfur transfer complex TusBCD TusB component (DsrH family)
MLKDKKNPVLKNNGYQSSYNEVDSDTPHAKIKSIKQLADKKLKCLYLDVDGVLCAMQYNPNFLKVKKAK